MSGDRDALFVCTAAAFVVITMLLTLSLLEPRDPLLAADRDDPAHNRFVGYIQQPSGEPGSARPSRFAAPPAHDPKLAGMFVSDCEPSIERSFYEPHPHEAAGAEQSPWGGPVYPGLASAEVAARGSNEPAGGQAFGQPRSGLKARGSRPPVVRVSAASVCCGFDKDIVRRIVRAHINEVRYCYNQGLARDPNLAGRVAVQFTIGPTGTVPASVVQESSLGDRSAAQCIAAAVKRWRFPKPQAGGSVVVTYPFVLAPG